MEGIRKMNETILFFLIIGICFLSGILIATNKNDATSVREMLDDEEMWP